MSDQHRGAILAAHVLHVRVPPGTSPERYQQLLDLLAYDIAPVVQALPPAAALVDVGGGIRFHRRTPPQLATLIRLRAMAWIGLDVHIGVAANWALAATASAYPGSAGICVIPDDPMALAEWLWPLPIDALHGIGRQQARTLRHYGLHTIGDLAGVPEGTAQRVLGGRAGRELRDRAWGMDPRAVSPTVLPRSTSERRDFDRDVLDPEVVRTGLLDAVFALASRLRFREQAAAVLELQLRFADHTRLTRSRRLREPSAHTDDLRVTAFELFAQLGLERARIRGVSVRAADLLDADQVVEQITFDRATENGRAVEVAVDRANSRFGPGAVRPARLAGPLRSA